jgi:hypothetical protein
MSLNFVTEEHTPIIIIQGEFVAAYLKMIARGKNCGKMADSAVNEILSTQNNKARPAIRTKFELWRGLWEVTGEQ